MHKKNVIPNVFWYMKPISYFWLKYEQITENPTDSTSMMKKPNILAKIVPKPTAAISTSLP